MLLNLDAMITFGTWNLAYVAAGVWYMWLLVLELGASCWLLAGIFGAGCYLLAGWNFWRCWLLVGCWLEFFALVAGCWKVRIFGTGCLLLAAGWNMVLVAGMNLFGAETWR